MWFIGYLIVAILAYGVMSYIDDENSKIDGGDTHKDLCFLLSLAWPITLGLVVIAAICYGVYGFYGFAKEKWFPKFKLSYLNPAYLLCAWLDPILTQRSEKKKRLRVAIEAEEKEHRKRLAEIEKELDRELSEPEVEFEKRLVGGMR